MIIQTRLTENIILAAVLAVIAMTIHSVIVITGYGSIAVSATISLTCFAYLIYVLRRSHTRTGHITCYSVALLLLGTLSFSNPSTTAFLFSHLLLITAVRVFYFYPHPIRALVDFGIQIIALTVAAWSFQRTGSLFLSTWCFFLTQALLSLIHNHENLLPGSRENSSNEPEQSFSEAQNQAEKALSQLINNQ